MLLSNEEMKEIIYNYIKDNSNKDSVDVSCMLNGIAKGQFNLTRVLILLNTLVKEGKIVKEYCGMNSYYRVVVKYDLEA